MATPSVRVLKLLAQLLTERRVPTDTEQDVFQSFNGFGADADQILKEDTPEITQSLAVICSKMHLEKKASYIGLKLCSPGNLTYTPDGATYTPMKAGTFVKNTFKKILERPEKQAQVLRQTKEEYNFLLKQKTDGNREFPKEGELQKLKKEELEIDKRLSGEEKEQKGEKKQSQEKTTPQL